MKRSTNQIDFSVNDEVKNNLKTSYNMQMVPRLRVDWNLNRYHVVDADNTPSDDTEGFDVEMFPAESLYEPLRPTAGIAKARVNESVASSGYAHPHQPRFYTGSVDDKYKYWTSPYQTDANGTFPLTTDGATSARPAVYYGGLITANKIVIKLENTWATPLNYYVYLQHNSATWTLISSEPAIDNDGQITLYSSSTGWTTTRPQTLVDAQFSAIQFASFKMKAGRKKDGTVMTYRKRGHGSTLFSTDGSYSSLNVISIEPHYEADLTNRLISVSDTFDMSEQSDLYPIGTLTTNQATVTLSNEDGIFDEENTSSPYYGLIEPNANFNLEYIYTINGTQQAVQQFNLYSTSWNDSDGTVDVELDDYSIYLKEAKPNPMMLENKTVTECIWRLLDSVGFNDYAVQENDITTAHTIPVFWVTGEDTVWEILDTLSQATQTAVYFDEYGTLQVKTRDNAFQDKTDDWTINGVKNGSTLPDIVSISGDSTFGSNHNTINYKTTNWKTSATGDPSQSIVWTPDTDVLVVRSNPLVQSLSTSDTHLFISQRAVRYWPYSSKVEIDGEVIEYSGKQFVYYTYDQSVDSNGVTTYSNPTYNVANPIDDDTYNRLNSKTPVEYQYMNRFTGGLKITERGVWNTTSINHNINNTSAYTAVGGVTTAGNTIYGANAAGVWLDAANSVLRIDSPSYMNNAKDWLWCYRGNPADTQYKVYGTRIAFYADGSSYTQRGGIVVQQSGTTQDGYYVEVCTTNSLTAAQRQHRQEVHIFSRKNGSNITLAVGSAMAVAENKWYDLDVYVTGTGTSQTITAWLNGQIAATAHTDGSNYQPSSGRFGVYGRGRSNIGFEYLYAIAREVPDPPDDYGFFDLKYGGVRGGAWQKEYVWEMRTRWKKIKKKKWVKETYRHNQYVFDEFGSYVHEVREFDVKFDPAPVQYSYLFSTNEWYTATLEYSSDPFGARFIIANTSRDTAILLGDDTLTYAGSGSSIKQVLCVLGRDLEVSDAQSIIATDDLAIRKRGEIDSEIDSDWIQSESMAQDVSSWMTKHWAQGADLITVEVFGNPLIEICDIVSVNYPNRHMATNTHKYYVVGTSNEFSDGGLSTTLTLRRKILT